MRARALRLAVTVAASVLLAPALHAHSGPPFPMLSNQVHGAYTVSIWTDPDTTDDDRPAGQFWVVLTAADGRTAVPADTRVTVTIRPLDRPGQEHAGRTTPVNGDPGNQFVALLMDHEGPFGVRVAIDGLLGRTEVESQVDATYDLRPSRWLIAVYLFPFLAIGALWVKVLRRRRGRG